MPISLLGLANSSGRMGFQVTNDHEDQGCYSHFCNSLQHNRHHHHDSSDDSEGAPSYPTPPSSLSRSKGKGKGKAPARPALSKFYSSFHSYPISPPPSAVRGTVALPVSEASPSQEPESSTQSSSAANDVFFNFCNDSDHLVDESEREPFSSSSSTNDVQFPPSPNSPLSLSLFTAAPSWDPPQDDVPLIQTLEPPSSSSRCSYTPSNSSGLFFDLSSDSSYEDDDDDILEQSRSSNNTHATPFDFDLGLNLSHNFDDFSLDRSPSQSISGYSSDFGNRSPSPSASVSSISSQGTPDLLPSIDLEDDFDEPFLTSPTPSFTTPSGLGYLRRHSHDLEEPEHDDNLSDWIPNSPSRRGGFSLLPDDEDDDDLQSMFSPPSPAPSLLSLPDGDDEDFGSLGGFPTPGYEGHGDSELDLQHGIPDADDQGDHSHSHGDHVHSSDSDVADFPPASELLNLHQPSISNSLLLLDDPSSSSAVALEEEEQHPSSLNLSQEEIASSPEPETLTALLELRKRAQEKEKDAKGKEVEIALKLQAANTPGSSVASSSSSSSGSGSSSQQQQLQQTYAQRTDLAELRRQRKRDKERSKEVGALVRLKLRQFRELDAVQAAATAVESESELESISETGSNATDEGYGSSGEEAMINAGENQTTRIARAMEQEGQHHEPGNSKGGAQQRDSDETSPITSITKLVEAPSPSPYVGSGGGKRSPRLPKVSPSKTIIRSMEQLVARMVFRRREAPTPPAAAHPSKAAANSGYAHSGSSECGGHHGDSWNWKWKSPGPASSRPRMPSPLRISWTVPGPNPNPSSAESQDGLGLGGADGKDDEDEDEDEDSLLCTLKGLPDMTV